MKKYIITACSLWIVILLASTLSAARIDEYFPKSLSDVTQNISYSVSADITPDVTASVQRPSSEKRSTREPMTMLLFGTCLTALATLERRRTKN